MKISLKSSGFALPGKRMTNVDLSKIVDTSDEWISSRTGIKTRYILSNDEKLSELCIKAAKDCLKESFEDNPTIDLIIVATSTSDNCFPSMAHVVQESIGATNAVAFDISSACSGFIYALAVAKSMLDSGYYKKALVIGADALSKYIDWKDRSTCVLFGDGAGAVVLESADDKENTSDILAVSLGSDGTGKESLMCEIKGEYPFITMQGQDVFKFAVRKVPKSIEEALGLSGVKKEEVKMYILHQANIRIIEAVAKKLEEPTKKFPSNLEKYGNTSAGSIPILLGELLKQKKLQKGDLIVLSGFGAGLSWGSIVLKI